MVKRTKPENTAALRKPAWTEDPDLIDYCVANDIPIKREIKWAELKAHIENTGKLPPGMKRETTEATYKVTTNGDES